jgi:hypothetical protein
MRQLIIGMVTGCLALASCKKNHDGIDLHGTYKGTFHRVSAGAWETSEVTLNFEGNQYNGESSKAYYPALCNGTVTINNNKADFNNACAWTANFDWTFVLNGEYDISVNGDTLRIERSYPGIILTIDKYELIKQY